MKKMNGLGKFSFALILSLIMCLGLFGVSAFAADGSLQDESVQGVVQQDSSQDGTNQDGSTQQGEDQTGTTQDGNTQQGALQEDAGQDGNIQEGTLQEDAGQGENAQEGTDQESAVQNGNTNAVQDGQERTNQDRTAPTDASQNTPSQVNLEEEDALGAVSVDTYAALQEAVSKAGQNPTTITITQTLALAGYLYIEQDQDITLTASEGAVLERSSTDTGSLCVNGTLTLQDIVLDGKNAASPYALLYITSTGAVTMDNAVIQNAYNSEGNYGGGVYNAGSLEMRNSTISGNEAYSYGGGAYNTGTFTVIDSEISGNRNSRWYGGGVYNSGTMAVTNSRIMDNQASNTSYGYGGGVYNSGTLTVTGSEISGNSAAKYGGGVYSSKIGVNMQDTVLSGNANGAVYVAADSAADASVYTLEGLTITGTTGNISALYINALSSWNILNCRITENVLTSGNAAEIKSSGYDAGRTSVRLLQDCIISGNTAERGSALNLFCSFGKTTVSGCTIADNDVMYGVYIQGNEEMQISNTRIEGNRASNTGGLYIQRSGSTNPVELYGVVITDNSGTTGGVYVGGSSVFHFNSGAIYGNTGSGDGGKRNDLYAMGANPQYTLIRASEMVDPQLDAEYFSKGEYSWAGVLAGAENAPVNGKGNIFLTAVSNHIRYAAQINDTLYQTLEEAIEQARSGDTIQFILGLGEDAIFGNKYAISSPITIGKDVTIALHDQVILADGKEAFLVVQNGRLTLQGTAMVDGQITVRSGGELAMDGGIVPYTYSDGKVTKKAFIINVEEDSSFTIHGTIPQVTYALPLEVRLAKGAYITAGEDFGIASSIQIVLDESIVQQFNNASGRDILDDLMFIQGFDDADLLSKITCEGVVSGLVQVKAIDGNIVLHKAVLAEGVYLDGTKGSDADDGMTTGTAVKTLDNAMAIAKEQGLNTIYVTGEVKVSGELDGDGITLMRYPTNLGHLLIATANLALSNITLDGASELGVTSGKSLLYVEKGTTTLNAGAVLQNNDVSANATYPWNYGGGVYIGSSAALEMNQGAVIENCTALFGGGVAANGTFTMNGGEIRYCNAVNTSGGGYGGGVVIFTNNGRMTMYDGTIHHNTAAANGGGIAQPTTGGYGYVKSQDDAYKNGQGLTIIGGTISDNVAMSSGGGIYIQCENKAVIGSENPDPEHMVRIIRNEAFGYSVNGFNNSLYAGGGIYVNGSKQGYDNGILQLYRVVVTQNTADNKGNGLGACPTGQLEIYISNGGAFYGNTGSVHDDLYMIGDAGVMGPVMPTTQGTYFFLSPTMLGGGASNWKRTANDIGGDLNMMEGYGASMQYYSDCTQESMDAALAEAGVLIEGNISHENGGGIGTNGTVTIGTQSDFTGIQISVTKFWNDDGFEKNRPNYIDAVIYRTINSKMRTAPVGEEFGTLRIYSLDEEGNEWPTVTYNHLPKEDSNGNLYTYYLKEVVYGDYSYLADIVQNPSSGDNVSFTITNRPAGTLVIKKALSGAASEAANKEFTFTVSGPNGYSEIVTITGAGEAVLRGLEDGSYTVMETGDTAIEGCEWSVEGNNVTVDVRAGVSSDVTVTNIYTIIRYTSLTVNKVWVGDTEDTRPSSVTVQCYHDDEAYGDPVTLNAANAWTYTWSNLNDVFTWTVRELNVPEGYTSAVSQEGTTFTITNTYTPVTPPPTPETPPTTPDRPRPDRPTTPEEPTVDIPDPDVPLAPAPPEEPPVIIEEPDVPLAEQPPEVELPEPEVPLAPMPPETTIPDPEVPLADVPRTGDSSGVWFALTALTACGLAVMNGRRKEENN